MKLLITVLLFFGFSYTSTAQLKKGIWLVGGSGSFYAYSEEYSSANINQKGTFTNIDVTATLGYFIIDKFALGLRPGFNSYKGKITTWKKVLEGKDFNGYVYYINANYVIDAKTYKKALARYANDARGITRVKGIVNNSIYVQEGKKVFVDAIKDIPADSEIYVAYGKEYWDVIRQNRKELSKENKRIKKNNPGRETKAQ